MYIFQSTWKFSYSHFCILEVKAADIKVSNQPIDAELVHY